MEEKRENVKQGDLADMHANEREDRSDKNEPLLEEPRENAKHGDLADMPANEEEIVTIVDVTDEDGGHQRERSCTRKSC